MGKKMVPSRCLFQKLSFNARYVCVSSQKLAVMQLEWQEVRRQREASESRLNISSMHDSGSCKEIIETPNEGNIYLVYKRYIIIAHWVIIYIYIYKLPTTLYKN